MLASMSEIDPHVDTPLMDWSQLDVSGLLPTGTVTLLLADVEGSTRLWETQPKEMTAAIARLNQTVSEIIVTHDGVRPVEQGEGDSFVAAFARASDAVSAALEMQRASGKHRNGDGKCSITAPSFYKPRLRLGAFHSIAPAAKIIQEIFERPQPIRVNELLHFGS